jgi:hypothetical protein
MRARDNQLLAALEAAFGIFPFERHKERWASAAGGKVPLWPGDGESFAFLLERGRVEKVPNKTRTFRVKKRDTS